MTVALTGATGFVGRQLFNVLCEHGYRVRPVVRSGNEAAFRGHTAVDAVVSTPDLFSQNPAWWAEALQGADAVIHAAWYAEPGKYLMARQNTACLIGTLNMAAGAVTAGVSHVVGIGTCFEYDHSRGTLDINTPLKPASPYASAKAAAYLHLSQSLALENVGFAWCRLFYLFGENEDPRRLIPYIRTRLAAGQPVELTSGSQVRDFLDVRTAAEMIGKVVSGKLSGPFNICSGVGITVRQIAEKIADEFSRRDLLRFGVRPDNAVDPPVIVGVPNV